MADFIFVAITIAFFGLSVLYVRACDRIVGPDDAGPLDDLDAELADLTEAGARPHDG
jgi:hypothetical protein